MRSSLATHLAATFRVVTWTNNDRLAVKVKFSFPIILAVKDLAAMMEDSAWNWDFIPRNNKRSENSTNFQLRFKITRNWVKIWSFYPLLIWELSSTVNLLLPAEILCFWDSKSEFQVCRIFMWITLLDNWKLILSNWSWSEAVTSKLQKSKIQKRNIDLRKIETEQVTSKWPAVLVIRIETKLNWNKFHKNLSIAKT